MSLSRGKFLISGAALSLGACSKGGLIPAPSLRDRHRIVHSSIALSAYPNVARNIEGFVEPQSVSAASGASDPIFFLNHLRTSVPNPTYRVEIYRQGSYGTPDWQYGVVPELAVTTSYGPAQWQWAINGCSAQSGGNWVATPPFFSVAGWRSGLYYANFYLLDSSGNPTLGYDTIPFVVRPANPGFTSKILVCIAEATYQAYNAYGQESLYDTPYSSFYWSVAFDRPYLNPGAGNVPWDSTGDVVPDSLFGLYEAQFAQFVEGQSIAVEYCTSRDLHNDSTLLANYNLLVSIGHDEYWSKQMRDNVDAFTAAGGNVCFFSGNVCTWQIRIDATNDQLICYKTYAPPYAQDPDTNVLYTTLWGAPNTSIADRPSNLMTGCGYFGGGIAPSSTSGVRSLYPGYNIQNTSHWIFEGTSLAGSTGAVMGASTTMESAIVGYETDAAGFTVNSNGIAIPDPNDGHMTPANLTILGWNRLASFLTSSNSDQARNVTMSIFTTAGGGQVFSAGSTGWIRGLTGTDQTNVATIMKNLLTRLASGRAV